MSLDYSSIYQALFDRAAVDSAGAALRALLPGAPASIFGADQLHATAGVRLPWLVWRPQLTTGLSEDMRLVGLSWWAYTAPGAGYMPLLAIARELDALYGAVSALAIDGGRLQIAFVGQPFFDERLQLNGQETRVIFRRLG